MEWAWFLLEGVVSLWWAWSVDGWSWFAELLVVIVYVVDGREGRD